MCFIFYPSHIPKASIAVDKMIVMRSTRPPLAIRSLCCVKAMVLGGFSGSRTIFWYVDRAVQCWRTDCNMQNPPDQS